jgi:hypothetical protein
VLAGKTLGALIGKGLACHIHVQAVMSAAMNRVPARRCRFRSQGHGPQTSTWVNVIFPLRLSVPNSEQIRYHHLTTLYLDLHLALDPPPAYTVRNRGPGSSPIADIHDLEALTAITRSRSGPTLLRDIAGQKLHKLNQQAGTSSLRYLAEDPGPR